MILRQTLAPAACAAFLGCGLIAGPDWELRRGAIEFYNDPVIVQLADTVSVTKPTTMSVITYGGGCVRKGPTEVSIDGLDAVVEPFDSVHVAAEACTLELSRFLHEVSLQFAERGTATVRVIGMTEPSNMVLTVTRTVVIQ